MTEFLIIFFLLVGVLLMIWGACVYGRRIIGKLWWILGELLQRWRR